MIVTPEININQNLQENKFPDSNNLLSLSRYVSVQKILNPASKNKVQWVIKRAIDISVSFLGITLLSPVWLLIVMLIKLDSKGPAIYRQKRIGLYKKEFYMYKFRSMVCDAEQKIEEIKHKNQSNVIMFKLKNDPRLTKVGKFLRRYSIDEFPQLINVLKGEMSLVGPRPPLPREVENYKDWHYIRFSTTPGLTGKWQVSGRSQIKSFDKVVYLDLNYIKYWNLLMDIKILLKTIPVVLLGRE